MFRSTCAVFTGLLLLCCACPSLAEKFPYRDYYPEIKIIELADLKKAFDAEEIVIVDVRSVAEFDAIHIKSSVNLPYSNAQFAEALRSFAKKNSGKKIAVYCNGITCIKCYKAAEDALYAGLQNVYAFDAGIVTWANEYPALTLFRNNLLTDSDSQFIDETTFQRSCLDFESFKKGSAAKDAVIIDSRDPIQRKQKLPGLDKALQIPIDKFVNNIIKKGNLRDKELYIFDQVGRQVNWLMYYLVENGYTDFFFLEGGATSVLKTQDYR